MSYYSTLDKPFFVNEVLFVPLTRSEVGCILAALNFTEPRTRGKSWESRDENIRLKIQEIFEMFRQG